MYEPEYDCPFCGSYLGSELPLQFVCLSCGSQLEMVFHKNEFVLVVVEANDSLPGEW